MTSARPTNARRFIAALATLAALTACGETTTGVLQPPFLRLPSSASGCAGQSCLLFNSAAPLNSAMSFADSSSAPVLLASVSLAGNTGDNLVLRLIADEEVLAGLPADELLTVQIDGASFTVALREAAAGVVVHRFSDARPVAVRYSINRKIPRALLGHIVLVQETAARVADLKTPWLSADQRAREARLAIAPTSSQCSELLDVSQSGSYCGIDVSITPWAPADAFSEVGATFQSNPGHGQSYDVVVSFSKPVENVQLTVYDPTLGGNRFTAYDIAGNVLGDKIFTGTGIPGYDVPELATASASPKTGAGIATITLHAVLGDYIAYSMKVLFDGGPLITGGVDLTASCGLSHQIRNRNAVQLAATYLVEETGETGSILLPAPPAGKSYSQTKLTTKTRGTLSIQYHGRVIARAPAPSSCS